MRLLVSALILAAIPGAAFGQTCEESFVKKGSIISGFKFTGTVTVPNLAPVTAINQLHGIVLANGAYTIMAEEAEFGSMLIEQPMSGKARAFPITISATQNGSNGTVVMEAKLRAGMTVKEADARTEMCSMLNQIVGGKAGLAAAKRAKGAVAVAAAPVSLDALSFSHQVSKDTQRNAAGVLTRYKGKAFTIKGVVDYVTRDGEVFRVGYKLPHPYEEALRLPNTAPFKTDIVCLMARGQAAYSLQLKPNKSINLTGTVDAFDEYRHVIWLKDCRAG